MTSNIARERTWFECLEPRLLFTSPALPTNVETSIVFGEPIPPGGTPNDTTRAHIKWSDTNTGLAGTTYRVQWTEYGSGFPTSITENLLTERTALPNNKIETTQILNAAQRRSYRVRAENGADNSDWVPVVPRTAADGVVQVNATASTNGITLHWATPVVPQNHSYTYFLYRKTRTATEWTTLVGPTEGLSSTTTEYTDSVSSGQGFEYMVLRSYDGGTPEFGTIYAGRDLPLVEDRGNILLVMDETLFSTSYHSSSDINALTTALDDYKEDLVGDGWRVLELQVERDIDDDAEPNTALQAEDVKTEIRDIFNNEDGGLQSIVLIGHVPVPYSGLWWEQNYIHDVQVGAWPADVYYGTGLADDVGVSDGWTDEEELENVPSGHFLQNSNVPSDGKFDNFTPPYAVNVPVGRIDFANLPEMVETFPPPNPNQPLVFITQEQAEMRMLCRYLIKDHKWRTKQTTVPTRGLIDSQFGTIAGGWLNFAPLVGIDNIFTADWESTLHTDGYLWASGDGGGSPHHANGVTDLERDFYHADHNINSSPPDPEIPYKSVFNMLLGSMFGDYNLFRQNQTSNLMRAFLGMEGYSLSMVLSGDPNWFFHPMAMGEIIGTSALATQNNVDGATYLPSGIRAQATLANLLGDPALRMTIVAPVTSLTSSYAYTHFAISWTASSDANVGYYVYRASAKDGPYSRVTSSPITSTSWTDSSSYAAGATKYYMVRAIRLQTTFTGTYYNASTGIITNATAPGGGGGNNMMNGGGGGDDLGSGEPAAEYVDTDSTTGGDWYGGGYGSEGYALASGYSSNADFFANASIFDELQDIWDSDTDATWALVNPGGSLSHRTAAAWNSGISSSLPDLDFDFGSGSYELSLYFVDANNRGREQRIELVNTDTGDVLAQRTVSDFGSGKYVKFNVQGHVAVRITATTGPNAGLSAVFVKAVS